MLIEIEKNKELSKQYSKYQLVNLVFLLLKKKKQELEKNPTRHIELTTLLNQSITDFAENNISEEEIKKLLEDE